ncbi:MAG: adenosylcobinamide-GDP ribazoletransferase [Pseudomonadota bacterium]
MKQEIQIFLTALMFFTRLPCPTWLEYSQDYLNKSTKYFPLIGWIVGGSAALVFWFSTFIFPNSIAVVLSMVTSILITGAFHEDGFADVCDGFGGGWTQEKILEIMKDSRVGAYGVIGIILILLLKYTALKAMPIEIVPLVLLAGHSISRFATSIVIFAYNYVRDDENSKIKPVAKKLSIIELIITGCFGIAPLLLLPSYYCLFSIIPVFLMTKYLAHFFKQKIGGYTGDCLGATQQLTEIVFYLAMVTEFWIFI